MASFRLCWFACGLLAGAVVAAGGHVAAGEAEVKKDVADLLDSGWGSGDAALAAAEEHYQAAEREAPGDAHLEYAWALVELKHHRYEKALAQLDQILKQRPDNRLALKWAVRVRILTKKHAAALVFMERLAQTVPQAVADTDREPDNLATAQFLGRMLGYLEGPADQGAKLSDETRARIVAHFQGDRGRAFEDARTRVGDQFADFNQQRERARSDAKEKDAKDKQQHEEDFEVQQKQIEKEFENIDADRKRIGDEQRLDEAGVMKDVRQADSERFQVQSQLSALNSQWNSWVLQRVQWQTALAAEKDPTRQAIIQNQLSSIDATLSQLDAQRQARQAESLGAEARRAAVEGNRIEIARRYQGTLSALDKREAAAHHKQDRLRNEQKKAERPAPNVSSKEHSLATRAAALMTYEEFPLESEKARLLGSLN